MLVSAAQSKGGCWPRTTVSMADRGTTGAGKYRWADAELRYREEAIDSLVL